MSPPNKSLISFMIGSPQAFIENARTLRDLWSGSYLVSWLTAKAMVPILQKITNQNGWRFTSPFVDSNVNELLKAVLGKPSKKLDSLLPSIPNKFSAIVDCNHAQSLANACVKAAKDAWLDLANDVKTELKTKIFDPSATWDTNWDTQLNAYFEFVCVTKPLDPNFDENWNHQWEQLGQLMEMSRSVRHVPSYQPLGELFPPKCSLLGTFEQMGPAKLEESRAFWQSAQTRSFGGTRLQKADRLCAISLVKRFAWPCSLSKTLQIENQALRYSDTATIAAGNWLSKTGIDPQEHFKKSGWNGHWLHWKQPNQESDEVPCPKSLFDRIQTAKKLHGAPPTYLSILNLDGDNMGALFQGRSLDQALDLTRRATSFGSNVLRIVEDSHNHGELIYCGGDDILALLPTNSVLNCTDQLATAFSNQMDDKKASLSGSATIVHYKEDLRYALSVGRTSERNAKQIDRSGTKPKKKNALSIAICRRSGDHSLATLSSTCVPDFVRLIQWFRDGVSDRWMYKLYDESPALVAVGQDAFSCEMLRLAKRSEYKTKHHKKEFLSALSEAWERYFEEMKGPGRSWEDSDAIFNFVELLKSASFLARGRE
jgi:CRISPR-associated protein Cmr2